MTEAPRICSYVLFCCVCGERVVFLELLELGQRPRHPWRDGMACPSCLEDGTMVHAWGAEVSLPSAGNVLMAPSPGADAD